MQMEQFHQLCERYCLNESPTLSFNDFETIFGVPPVGKTRGPEPKKAFGYDHKLSVAFAFDAILRGAKSKGFDLNELLPPSCFDHNGRILKPQLREMLARMRIYLTDENFRRLWEEKFDLEGIGSISTQQLLDQLGLSDKGTPKNYSKVVLDGKFPPEHRSTYSNFNGYKPILDGNNCLPVTLDPVSHPLQLRAEKEKPVATCTAGDKQSRIEEIIPSINRHFNDQLQFLRQHRPYFRNIIEQLQYIFDESRLALGLVLEAIIAECGGRLPIRHLTAVFGDVGLTVSLEEMRRYAKRQGLFVDNEKNLCTSTEEDIDYEKFLRQMECAAPVRTSSTITIPDPCGSKKGLGKIRLVEDELYRILHKVYLDFVDKLEKNKKDGGVALTYFRELIEQIVGFSIDKCQWEELLRQIRLKDNCKVDLNHFLSCISSKCANSPYKRSNAADKVHDPELKSLLQFSGESRELPHLLLAIQKLITEKFSTIDKIYKHFDHAGHATIDKEDFGVLMKRVGLDMCEAELAAVWRLVDEAEPSTKGLHKYRQVMRFFLETGKIRYHLAVGNRSKRLHDPNLSKLREFRQCQKNFKKQQLHDIVKLGKAASEIKYIKKRKEKPTVERVNELCKRIRSFVISIWTDLRNGFLWQDPLGWGTLLCKDFQRVCEAFQFPLDRNELEELAYGLDEKNKGYVNYVAFLSRFSENHTPPKVGQKFDIVHHKLKNNKDGSELGIREVMDKIRQICLSEYKTLLAGFRAIADPKHPDFFNEKDLSQFLHKHGMDFSTDCIYHLRTAYDKHHRGCIDYTDFLQQTMDVTRPLE